MVKLYKLPYFSSRGFTLIELMVTVGIFVFMTALIMAKYNNFYSGTIFKNMAYDIAITIRQAQSYGISVKADSNSTSFNKSYGVNFSSSFPTKFTLYPYSIDSNGLYVFDNIAEKAYTLKFGASVYRKYAGSSPSDTVEVSVLDIIFQRPNPEAVICGTINSVMNCSYKYAKIVIKLGEITRSIEINSVGQVSILES
jgi:prepilin-type N-terminal cleavage/methylation domain-containing protein